MSLRFEHVGKRYPDGTIALGDVSFEVPPGQFCVILGRSGAGKSTLLRCVNGLASPSSGRVVVDGVEVTPATLRQLRPRIGMIHQSFNLVPRASVAANVIAGALPAVSTGRALLGLFPRALRDKACALIADVGLGQEHLPRRVAALSGGQQQRVGIARAFMLDPAYVLADEPVASLDPQTSADILTLIRREAKERGAAVLCSLHQIDLTMRFADRVLALRDGRIVFDGAPDALAQSRLGRIYDASWPEPCPLPEAVGA
ncbi:phosphonate ABC transporter ATP-binding protein [Novosphingobium album (ex Liu et al. 2023)]|uniref:Phosphonate ABC transporter ATP-binding protein n=1 Tax=Novosphingobium album (ex Liu et al. 2023) TaxID=3031130 RepID=A0ABT5WX64_9SPHN|nr:phosphonate ABC transporter ATP-binding protein [Novosphingobium album (ex Liu et al. 2023)]MDE8654476.1 phosphonate ABC transporter ATP-binding protein [Novosphingobium album (ex Liu et al. 2023)]